MKQIFTLTIVALISTFSLHAQIKLTRESHGFQPGIDHLAKKLEYKEPGESGINVVWDFSKLAPTSDVNVSPVVKIEEEDCNVGISRNDGLFFLYDVTDNQIDYKGYRKGERTYYFSKPVVKIIFPETYGTSFDGTFSGTITTNGQPDGNIVGTYSTKVDGTGTILLPGNVSLPVIRVKTLETTTEWGPDNRVSEISKYLWYAQNVRFPVFVSVEVSNYNPKTNSKTITEQTSYLNTNLDPTKQGYPEMRAVTGIDDLKTDISFKASPNPFKDNLSISYSLSEESTISIELFNVQGTKLATILPKQTQQGNQAIEYNIGSIASASGIYFLTVTIDGKTYNEKLIKR